MSGAWRTITAAEAFVGGAWRTLVSAEAYVSGAWRGVGTFVQPLTLATSPSAVSKTAHAFIITSDPVTATPSGGAGPYSYAWSVFSGGPFTINSPTSATTTITANVTGGDKSGTVQCVVTDSLGTTASATVDVSITYDTGGL